MEPMITGSPPSPIVDHSNRLHNSHLFLPSYLLGQSDTPGGARSHAGDNVGTPSSSKFYGGGGHHRVTWSPELNQTNYYEATSPPPGHYGGSSGQIAAVREQMGGPPVRGLASEQLSARQGSFQMANSFSQPADNFSPMAPPNLSTDFNSERFDDDQHSEHDLNNCCITVFGFPPGYLQFILQQFSQYGTVLNYETPNKCNWVHIRYQSKIQAAKALSKNGKVFNDCIQIGVIPCTEQKVISRLSRVKEDALREISNRSPLQTNIPFANGNKSYNSLSTTSQDEMTSSKLQSPVPRNNMRPLASHAAGSNISENSRLLGKSDGLLVKARQYMFGW